VAGRASALSVADILSAPGAADILFLVPTRCVGTWKLRAAEGFGDPMSLSRTPVPRFTWFCGREHPPWRSERPAERHGGRPLQMQNGV